MSLPPEGRAPYLSGKQLAGAAQISLVSAAFWYFVSGIWVVGMLTFGITLISARYSGARSETLGARLTKAMLMGGFLAGLAMGMKYRLGIHF